MKLILAKITVGVGVIKEKRGDDVLVIDPTNLFFEV